MNFNTIGFTTLRMHVADPAKSAAWFQKFFGKAPEQLIENFAMFEFSNVRLDIVRADEKSPLSAGGSVGYWLVDDVESAISHAVEIGGEVYRGPLPVPDLGRTIVQIKDPFGNVFGLEGPLRKHHP